MGDPLILPPQAASSGTQKHTFERFVWDTDFTCKLSQAACFAVRDPPLFCAGNIQNISPMPQLVQDNLDFFVLTTPYSNVAGDVLFLSDTIFHEGLVNTTIILSLTRFTFFFGGTLILNPRKFLMS